MGGVNSFLSILEGIGQSQTPLSRSSIQQPIPIVPLMGFVAEIGNEPLHVRNAHAESRAGLGNHILFDHDAAEIIGATPEGNLADLLALCDPGALDVGNIVEVNARQCLRP